ncbi:hypothetical protein Salat_0572000 [Sesamum alatum]|uniref:Uncharacterized protein n=1 Tax=Sesamum alatum TaxID=300844 RepID=A0AAE1YQI3_9LAMI|nr:hypothetical protein Salat_0572000 [Sesamum alatum]
MGEKKTPAMLQGQSFLIKASNSSLPPLLEPPPTLLESQSNFQDHHPPIMQTLNQNPNNFLMIQTQESDLKSLINPLVSQSDLFSPQPTSSFTPNKNLSIQFPSSQDFSFKELSNAIAKQYCKKEASFEQPHFQLLADGFVNTQWAERIQENTNKYQLMSPFLLDEMGIPSATVAAGIDDNVTALDSAAIDHVMSTEPAFRWW